MTQTVRIKKMFFKSFKTFFGACRYRQTSKINSARLSSSTKSENKLPSLSSLIKNLSDLMGIEKGFKPIPKCRQHLQNLIVVDQKQLPPRSMLDSYVVCTIPLTTDPELQDQYVSITGYVRIGRLLQDMDIFAVIVAQQHILNPKVKEGQHSPYTIVTALVDRIDFETYRPRLSEDIRMSGHVSWVGRTSIEVIVWLDQKAHGEYHRITKAVFLLAIRDALNAKSAAVNPLVPKTAEEKALFAGGEIRKKYRSTIVQRGLTKTLPNEEEQKVMHDLFKRTLVLTDLGLKRRILPSGCVWIENSTLSNVITSHPENRNLHNTVFGGFIMRHALEISYTLGRLFSKHRPVLKSISDLNFAKPVSMHSILSMHAYVVYTHLHYMQIIVYVEGCDFQSKTDNTTSIFHFTYEVPEIIPEVFPRTYNETMMYIDGRRHFNNIMQKSDSIEPVVFKEKNSK